MISRSLIEMTKCRWREFRREPSAFFWVMFMPIVWMVALGFAFSNPKPERYGIGWETPTAQTQLTEDIHAMLAANKQIALYEGSQEEVYRHFQRGDVAVMMKVTPEGTQYRFDPANPVATRGRDFVDGLIQTLAGRKNPVNATSDVIKTQGGRYVDFLVPGLLGLSIMTSSLFGVGMTLVANRRENLLKRYLATPMRKSEYMTSQVFGRLMVLTAEFLTIYIASRVIFNFKIYGDLFSYIIVAIMGAAAFTAIAMLCASRTRSIPTVSGITNLISLPMMMLSGVFFSKNNLPDWLQAGVNYLPLTALNDGLRKIALEGQTLAAVGPEMLVLAAYFVVCSLITSKIFKWY